jgi:predicted phosphodiesterase
MRLICTSDQHYPVHDPVVENVVLKFAQHVKPTHWVLNGDLFDFFSVSRYDKEPDRKESLQDEFDSARPYINEVCALANEVHYIPGNHEQRLERLFCDVPGLAGLRALKLHRAAELPPKVKVHAPSDIVTVGRIGVMHGHQVKGAGNPAAWVLGAMPGMSYIFGHFHRSQTVYRTARDPDGGTRSFVVAAQGHGCDERKAKYDPACPNQNWQKGFTYVEFFTVAGKRRFSLHPIVIVNGAFSWGGKVFDGRRT